MSPDYFVTYVSGPYPVPPNKQLQRTVRRYRERVARASLHCALAPRWLAQRAAADSVACPCVTN
jgi:hypothetical protein